MRSLESKLTERFEAELGGPLRAASPATVNTKGLFIWVFVGVMGGLVAHLALDIGSQAIMQGVGAGIGLLIGMLIMDRNSNEDPSQPGGYSVALGVTDTHLVVFSRPLWPPNKFALAGTRPLTEIQSITAGKGWPAKVIDITLLEGGHWRYEINKWERLEEALPTDLIGSSA